ncbi:MAG TPA: sigma-54 dependent transcriptional regulator [Burkholderiales bacterium]|nr:sigma-54 dependent transcriptional regulator [Burkholderiales bacterium]
MNTSSNYRESPLVEEKSAKKLLTFPDHHSLVLSIRAKALVFNDPQSEALLERVERIAPSEATVLIIGETGTGKELLARHIHDQSGRRGPFVAVNCGAFSESLVEAEFFGHESGAFTGASQARAGWFETANGGTLFLDEIGDLPLAMQVKLLRVLQERQVVRIGSRRAIPIDVRLVAATNVDLVKAVAAGHFRMDLYYRLNVATVDLPPLRERPGDVMPLARHFVDIYRAKLQLPPIAISVRAERALLDYAWPGNIRELENVIHYALIVCSNNIIDSVDLKLSTLISNPASQRHTVTPAPAAIDEDGAIAALSRQFVDLFERDAPDLYRQVEEALVRSAFEFSEENQVRSARLLGISRNVLRAQLKRFGLLKDRSEVDEGETVS